MLSTLLGDDRGEDAFDHTSSGRFRAAITAVVLADAEQAEALR